MIRTLSVRCAPALLGLAALLAAGCGTVPNAAPAIDYRRDVRVIAIEEFSDDSPQPEQQTVYYNTKTEEGRHAAADARDRERRAWFTFAVAHNVARRIHESEDALRARGLAVPVVLAVTRNYPQGLVATGAKLGRAFDDPPKGLPAPSVRVRGAIRWDVSRSAFTEFFQYSEYGKLYPYDRFEAAAELTIDEREGAAHRYFVAFVSKPEGRNLGLPGLDPDPRGQLVARVAEHLAPTTLRIDGEAPLAFVRRVVDERTIEVDLGLERRTLRVAAVHDLETPLPEAPSREDLERALDHQYVRIRWRGGPEAAGRSIWRRVDVEEPPPS